MKFRNKETWEIRKAEAREDGIYLWDVLTGHWYKYELDTIARRWEYYVEPKEPLIKDEKIRKAVKAWAEANHVTRVKYDASWNSFRCTDFVIGFDYDFDRHDGLEDEESYTIAELCGEEDE